MTLEEHRKGLATREAKYSITEKVIDIFKFDFSDLVSEYKLDQVVKFDKEGKVLEEGILGALGSGIKIVTIINKAIKAAKDDSKLMKASKALFKEIAASKNPHKVNNASLKTIANEYEQFILDVCEEDGRIGIACKKLGISYTTLAKKLAAKFKDQFIEEWNKGSEKDHLKTFEHYGVKLPKEKDPKKEKNSKKMEERFALPRKGRRVYEDDFSRHGVEIDKSGTVLKKMSNGEFARPSGSSPVTAAAKAVAHKVKKENPDLYDDMTAKNDDRADIRAKKNIEFGQQGEYAVYRDGEEKAAEVYKVSKEDIKNMAERVTSKNARANRIAENMKRRIAENMKSGFVRDFVDELDADNGLTDEIYEQVTEGRNYSDYQLELIDDAIRHFIDDWRNDSGDIEAETAEEAKQIILDSIGDYLEPNLPKEDDIKASIKNWGKKDQETYKAALKLLGKSHELTKSEKKFIKETCYYIYSSLGRQLTDEELKLYCEFAEDYDMSVLKDESWTTKEWAEGFVKDNIE